MILELPPPPQISNDYNIMPSLPPNHPTNKSIVAADSTAAAAAVVVGCAACNVQQKAHGKDREQGNRKKHNECCLECCQNDNLQAVK